MVTERADEMQPTRSDPPYVWNDFLQTAQRFARSALEHYSPDDAPFFFLHAGASVEHGVKAVLCRANPVLLLEAQRFSEIALLRFAGFQPARAGELSKTQMATTRRANTFPYTVGFAKSIDRLELLYGKGVLGDDRLLDELKAARDLSAHAIQNRGQVSDSMHRVVSALAKAFDRLLGPLDTTPVDFWGEHISLIEGVLRNDSGLLRRQVRTLFAAAQRRFDKKYEGIDPESLEDLKQDAFYEKAQPETERRSCPICFSSGSSHVRAELRREVDDLGNPVLLAGFSSLDFQCFICGLTLEDESLVHAAGPEFQAWESEGADLEIWLEAIGAENLDPADMKLLNIDFA